MARKPKGPKQVEALKHDAASRKNIPTAEHASIAERMEELNPFEPVTYERATPLSVFNGPDPTIVIAASQEEELNGVSAVILAAIGDSFPPEEIGVFVRSDSELSRARDAVKKAGQSQLELSDRVEDRSGRVAIGNMHLAKGLEFRHVIVMACDDGVLPDQNRIDTVADEVELDEVYETERHLFYVACTRAREKLTIFGIQPGSEFIADLK